MTDFGPAAPEMIVAIGAMALLLIGVFRKETEVAGLNRPAALLIVAALVPFLGWRGETLTAFNGLFVLDGFSIFIKTLVLLATAAAIMMSGQFFKDKGVKAWEFPVLMAFAALGMMLMVSAASFLTLYLGLEMQSLSLYVLAAINRDRPRPTEAGLKYFVLGAVASGILLYGISLVYGFTGALSFETLQALLGETGGSLGLTIGLVFILSGLAFKVAAVPFHMWTPDVYEGAPTPVTAFFAAAPKVAAMALLTRITMETFPALAGDWQLILIALAAASMALGALVALVQTNIKRLMAYSSIGHVGYALVGLAAGTVEGVQALLVYLAIYVTMTLGTFACILAMKNEKGYTENIADLAGLSKTYPRMAFLLALFMFSLAGIPLLAGFFAKWYVFKAAVDAGLWWLAVFGVVASVVAAYYYVRIVKLMYFDDPAPDFIAEYDAPKGAVMVAMGILNSPVSLF
ncbi:MAG TPA: NADH-quinone oxidoreductase subunit NuoN, partial [Sphingomonadales bacterium]|nr:NADH-quinone oxidoreductase subunit NuoN [Sphingomonadales bacterium]